MLTGLRTQVQTILYSVPAKRKPALRRSDVPDALFATDLPLIAEAEAVDAFRSAMLQAGWSTEEARGWLLLRAAIPVPVAEVPENMQGECGCCISLLLRHPGPGEATTFIYAVAKAADAGFPKFDRLCGQLHADFAARLRNGEALPEVLLPYLCAAYHTFYTRGDAI